MKKRLRDRTLEFLDAVSDGLLLFELNGKYRYAYLREGRHGIKRLLAQEERRDVNRRLDMSKRRGLISESKSGRHLKLSLTDRGRETLERKAARDAGRRKDGRRVYIMYDIPEHSRPCRDRLRTFLKRAGFSRHQRSVWRTDRDVEAVVEAWIKRSELRKWVDIHVA
ncbi:MAG TPA: CRISPR-associated endonuclease Cas2 [Candidatus Eisenbacteria bacterium]|nr:CRISPR-associated endonuclease Cas2 [Candidatus Eisenbacteria bacterium]